MELTSQKLRKIALSLKVHLETVIREADIFWIWSKRQDRVLQRQVVSELVISVRISVTEKHRDMMESTIHCRPEI